MHEFSLCQNLLNQVLETAQKHHASAVKRIDACLGPQTGIQAEQLCAAFVTASAGTAAAQAELRIEALAPLMHCQGCGKEYSVESGSLNCPACSSTNTVPLPAATLLITNVELVL